MRKTDYRNKSEGKYHGAPLAASGQRLEKSASRTRFFVINDGEYLYYNPAILKGGYYFQQQKNGAVILTRKKADTIIKYLKKQGFLNVYKRKIR